MNEAIIRAARLPVWQGRVDPEPLGGGISNTNFTVIDAGRKFVVRIGGDHVVHRVMRFNEVAIARAAAAAGIGPEVVYHEPGALVMAHIAGRTLVESDLRDPAMLDRVVALLRNFHNEASARVRGPVLAFPVFHAIRDYAATAREDAARLAQDLDGLLGKAATLERDLGPLEVTLCHNDLLAANLIDDGERLWLVDYEHAGFNAALFDLANLSSNNRLSPDMKEHLLAAYFGAAPDRATWRGLAVLECVSLLREALWSLVSETHSELDFDYAAYTDRFMARFHEAYDAYRAFRAGRGVSAGH